MEGQLLFEIARDGGPLCWMTDQLKSMKFFTMRNVKKSSDIQS